PPGGQDLHQVADVQALRRRVEAGVEGHRPGGEVGAQRLRVGGVLDQTPPAQPVENVRHARDSPSPPHPPATRAGVACGGPATPGRVGRRGVRAMIRGGAGGWQYRRWRDRFYPPGLPQRLWLAHYATRFRTVEINSAFYRLPERDTFAAW